nr:MAG TPA: hypothetical protein [Caudoviricetes sp.]
MWLLSLKKSIKSILLLISIAVLGKMKSILSMMNQQQENNKQNLPSQELRQRSLKLTDNEESFYEQYPLISQRKEQVANLTEALSDENSLVLIDKKIGEGIALKWIKAQLLDAFRILGAADVINSIQIVIIARRIRNIYYYLTPSEITYFLESLIGGNYGTIYVGKAVNPQNIMEALKQFDTDRANRLSEIEVDKAKEINKVTKEINIDKVNEICKRIRMQINKNKFNQK